MSAHRIQQIIDRIDLDRISPNNYASKNPSDASFHDMCVEEADFILSTLRPGEGLVGTFEEQAKYIETREAEANVEQNEAHSVQGKFCCFNTLTNKKNDNPIRSGQETGERVVG